VRFKNMALAIFQESKSSVNLVEVPI